MAKKRQGWKWKMLQNKSNWGFVRKALKCYWDWERIKIM